MSNNNNNDDAGKPWTSVDVDPLFLDADSPWKSPQLADFLESVMRVTFAGFGGALVGLSHQRASSGSKIFHRAAMQSRTAAGKPQKGPPMAALRNSAATTETNLPAMWAGSFMVFVAILETSRVWSPASHILDAIRNNDDDTHKEGISTDDAFSSSHRQSPTSTATILDYTLGGTVAGLAGSMARRPPPVSSSSNAQLQLPSSILHGGRRTLMISGIGTGMALGCLAGILQVGMDWSTNYLEELQIQQQLEEQERLEQEALQADADGGSADSQ